MIYEINPIEKLIKGNSYVGRGIITGLSEDGKNAVIAYFIMGRSANSRNRIFNKKNDELFTVPFDISKVEDPSLIIYAAIRQYSNNLIVTNGDQTDTIYNGVKNGLTFSDSLETREFEPDAPNFTPRISSMLTFDRESFKYQMSILKSADEKGTVCNRYTFKYNPLPSLGHFIHTYNHDGNPLPTFTGEPKRVFIPSNINNFANDIWNNLDEENKISLYVRYTSLADGTYEDVLINKNK